MALLNVLFDRPKRMKLNQVDENLVETEYLVIDMTRNISHQHSTNPTNEPVEEGVNITDHLDLQPKVLSFEGIISEAPITLEEAAITNVAGAIPAVGGFGNTIGGTLFSGAVSQLGGLLLNKPGNRVDLALNSMIDLMEKGIPVTIITGLRAYNNMILQSFNPIETANTGDSLAFTATFKEIKIIESAQIILPASIVDPSVENKVSSAQKLGGEVANTTTKGPATGSVLFRGLGLGG